MGLQAGLIPRNSTIAQFKRTRTQIEIEENLDKSTFLLFNVLRERREFFKGLVWKQHHMSMELLESCNLWQVTIQTEESFNSNEKPDEVFLL